MKKLAVLLAVVFCAAPVFAGDTGILKLSLWGDIAVAVPNNTQHVTGVDLGIGSSTEKIDGLQLDLIYSEAGTVRGINSAFIVSKADLVYGLQGGIYNKANSVYGIQGGLIAINETELVGLHDGWINIAHGTLVGVQAGIYNQVEDLHGVQLGLVNNARFISKGLQIGLVNIAKNGWVKVLPIVNGHF